MFNLQILKSIEKHLERMVTKQKAKCKDKNAAYVKKYRLIERFKRGGVTKAEVWANWCYDTGLAEIWDSDQVERDIIEFSPYVQDNH